MSSLFSFYVISGSLAGALLLIFPSVNVYAQPDITPLGEMKLQYEQSRSKHVPEYQNATGKYLGSGTGSMKGHVKAKVKWDLYENQNRDDLHKALFVGFLETEDGDRIPFESMGYFKQRKGGQYWDLASSVYFDCDNPKYPGLVSQRIFWEGAVKTGEWSHEYRLYTVSN